MGDVWSPLLEAYSGLLKRVFISFSYISNLQLSRILQLLFELFECACFEPSSKTNKNWGDSSKH